MNQLILVPFGTHYVNPAQIAGIESTGSNTACILLVGGNKVYCDSSVDQVIDRLKSHCQPAVKLSKDEQAPLEVLALLSDCFPSYAPTTIAAGFEKMVQSFKSVTL